MGRYASDSGNSTYTPAPTGTHVARCIKIIDLGTQNSEYQGQPTRRNQVLIVWELPEELAVFDGEEKPIAATKFYTNSLNEKANLRRDLESWRGRAFTDDELNRFDLETILGVPCLLTIVAAENGKSKVAAVSGVPRSMTCPPQFNKSQTFWLDEFDQDKFDELSDGLKKIIAKSEEYPQVAGHAQGHAPSQAPPDDDIPF